MVTLAESDEGDVGVEGPAAAAGGEEEETKRGNPSGATVSGHLLLRNFLVGSRGRIFGLVVQAVHRARGHLQLRLIHLVTRILRLNLPLVPDDTLSPPSTSTSSSLSAPLSSVFTPGGERDEQSEPGQLDGIATGSSSTSRQRSPPSLPSDRSPTTAVSSPSTSVLSAASPRGGVGSVGPGGAGAQMHSGGFGGALSHGIEEHDGNVDEHQTLHH